MTSPTLRSSEKPRRPRRACFRRSPTPSRSSKEIVADLQRGRLSDPHFSQFYRVEALVALSQGKLPEAKTAIGNAIESDPTNGDNALVLAEIHYAIGEVPAAKTFLEESVQLSPALVRSHALLARISLEQQDAGRARSEALEGLKLNPLHPPSYLILADVAAAQNQLREARGLYETCGRLAKFTSRETAGRAYFRLGKLHELSGDKPSADQSYRLAYYYFPKADPALDEQGARSGYFERRARKARLRERVWPRLFPRAGGRASRAGKDGRGVAILSGGRATHAEGRDRPHSSRRGDREGRRVVRGFSSR